MPLEGINHKDLGFPKNLNRMEANQLAIDKSLLMSLFTF